MFESGYYPAGAEHDPRAPWNEIDPTEEIYDVEVETCHDDPDDEEEGGHAEKQTITVSIEVYHNEDDHEILELVDDAVREELGNIDYEILDYWAA